MSKHTPGPWRVFTGGVDSAGGRIVDAVDPVDGRIFIVASVCGVDKRRVLDARTEANARLIAAAPQLLEALQDMVSDHADLSPGTLAFARAAIAAATETV